MGEADAELKRSRSKVDIPEELLRRTPRKRTKVDYSQTYGHDYDDEDFDNSASEEEEEESVEESEEDSEDDAPLSDLVKSKPTRKSKPRSKAKPKAKSNAKSKSNGRSKGRNAAPVAEPVGRTQKEEIVEKILRRRGYCLEEWPPEGLTLDSNASEFITCGIKGILVGFRGESTGLIKDLRPRDGLIPSVNCLLKRPAEELKAMLIKGIEAQKADLEKSKEQNELQLFTDLMKELDKELKGAKKINDKKVDKDHAKGVVI